MKKIIFKIKKEKRKGFVLLFAVTLAAIFLSIALGVADIALKEVKFGTSAKDTNNAFYAADTGVECALFYDKSGASSFVTGSSPSLVCNNSTVTASENPSLYWSFTLSGLNTDGQGCAKVTIDKRSAPNTTILANGYNNGGSSCTPVANTVERELKTNY
jgi:hypothetical protein